MADKPRATGSFDKLEVHTIVPRPTVENTGEKRVVFGNEPGDIFTFKAGTIVEGLDQATSGNPPDLSDYYNKEETDALLADKEDASEGATHALKADVDALDAEDIAAVPAGVQSDSFDMPGASSVTQTGEIRNTADAIAYNLELTRLVGNQLIKLTPDIDLDRYQEVSEKDEPLGYAGLDDTGRVIAKHLDTDDIKEDIVVIKGELASLVTIEERGNWGWDVNNPPSFGKLHLSSEDLTVDQLTAVISKEDADGAMHSFATAEVGSWIEIVEDDADYCLGQIESITQTGENFQCEISVSVGKGVASEGTFKVRIFEASAEFDPESIRIVDITPAPPLNPTDGDLWFDNSENSMQLQVYHQESDAWIAAAPPSTLDSRVSAGEALQAQIGEAVVNLQSDKLSNSGDDMYGSYYATEGRHLKFFGQDGSGRKKTFIDIVNTNGQGTEGTDFKMSLYHVATPTGPYHAANQKYVDDSISDLVIPDAADLTELEAKVDSMLTEADIRNIVKSHGGTPILWKYNSSVPADSLGNGEFNLSSGLSNGSAGEWSIYFANRDARGQRWFPHDSGNEYTHEVGDQMATIRERDAIICHGKTTKWYFNQGSNNYVRLKLTYYRNQFAMSSGKWYLMNIPGYMPFFTYSSNSYSNGTHT